MKMFVMFAIVAVAFGLSGCGVHIMKGDQGDTGAVGAPGADGAVVVVSPTPVPATPTEADIASVLADENAYRLGLGQTMLSNGLSCTLYSITGGDRIQSSIGGHNTLSGITTVATYLYKGLFNQPDSPISDGMNVLPTSLRAMYKNMYLLRCSGQIVVLESAHYGFELNSDDASLLYIDGVKVIDNDNNHGTTMVTGSKYLRRGVHTIRLDYAQTGAGSQSLQLTSSGVSIDPMYYFH